MTINLSELRQICSLPEEKLRSYLLKKLPKLRDCDTYLFLDRGSKVLAVAHMDVSPRPRSGASQAATFHYLPDKQMVMHPWLDDRLGVYALSCLLLQELGIAADLLFCTDEEVCASTARDFALDVRKNYNWIFELDRAGDDVVLYGYESNDTIIEDLQSVGFQLGIGSYSDICELEALGASGFNCGIGYYLQHSQQCYALLNEFAAQLTKLKVFYDRFADKKYTHTPSPIFTFEDDFLLYDEWLLDEGFGRKK